MKNKTLLLFTLFHATLILIGCKKKTEIDVDKKKYLTSKSWKIAQVDKNVSTNPKGKIVYYPGDCLDYTYQFKENGVLNIIKDDPNNCFLSKQDDVVGTYNLADKELKYEGRIYKILEITPNQIKFYIDAPTSADYNSVVYLLE
ncbi:hypothetical protein [Pedobacter caeni]|uniref:Lipocalin-like domain-containing protein n=1 Tax=Pedobacter caeni TaxID=288992 RepID=A0A1M4TN03_9SPHI|nr:hypothetical protein [Pedobacter caeni]SHE45657.1 hypothetical protein SAMN04488522_101247 [Pedobacter caeni]